MTLYQFKKPDETEQIECVWARGVSLAKRSVTDFNFELFQIDGFYIETKSRIGDRGYDALKSFVSGPLPEPYLSQIEVKKYY